MYQTIVQLNEQTPRERAEGISNTYESNSMFSQSFLFNPFDNEARAEVEARVDGPLQTQ